MRTLLSIASAILLCLTSSLASAQSLFGFDFFETVKIPACVDSSTVASLILFWRYLGPESFVVHLWARRGDYTTSVGLSQLNPVPTCAEFKVLISDNADRKLRSAEMFVDRTRHTITYLFVYKGTYSVVTYDPTSSIDQYGDNEKELEQIDLISFGMETVFIPSLSP